MKWSAPHSEYVHFCNIKNVFIRTENPVKNLPDLHCVEALASIALMSAVHLVLEWLAHFHCPAMKSRSAFLE